MSRVNQTYFLINILNSWFDLTSYVSTAILGNNDPKLRSEIESKMTSLIPMGRLGEADEVFLTIHLVPFHLMLNFADCRLSRFSLVAYGKLHHWDCIGSGWVCVLHNIRQVETF